jgi:hypothetical protein
MNAAVTSERIVIGKRMIYDRDGYQTNRKALVILTPATADCVATVRIGDADYPAKNMRLDARRIVGPGGWYVDMWDEWQRVLDWFAEHAPSVK